MTEVIDSMRLHTHTHTERDNFLRHNNALAENTSLSHRGKTQTQTQTETETQTRARMHARGTACFKAAIDTVILATIDIILLARSTTPIPARHRGNKQGGTAAVKSD